MPSPEPAGGPQAPYCGPQGRGPHPPWNGPPGWRRRQGRSWPDRGLPNDSLPNDSLPNDGGPEDGRPVPGGPDRRRLGHHRPHPHLRGPIRRSTDTRVLAGVCGGLSAATGIDVTLVRIGFALLTLASGVGILVYALAWLFFPLQGETTSIVSRAAADRRGIRLVIALVPAFVVVQVVAATLHVGYVGSFAWPVFLAAVGAILIRRNASEEEKVWINDELMPMLRTGVERHGRFALVLRVTVGVVLGIGGLFVLVIGHRTAAALRPVAGAVLVVTAIDRKSVV